MAGSLERILALEVPIIVQLGHRLMPLGDIISLIPGAIIELPKGASEELELLVNNRIVGFGTAVKVGENFGLKIARIGDARDRVNALGAATPADATHADPDHAANSEPGTSPEASAETPHERA
ncbi:MAG: FliM/FliN family flagellar motor switch protein [Phycisphaerae bacterium]|nr:FliM/FliN family flagellar motor switch protein [Phycisphaerae bacterium]